MAALTEHVSSPVQREVDLALSILHAISRREYDRARRKAVRSIKRANMTTSASRLDGEGEGDGVGGGENGDLGYGMSASQRSEPDSLSQLDEDAENGNPGGGSLGTTPSLSHSPPTLASFMSFLKTILENLRSLTESQIRDIFRIIFQCSSSHHFANIATNSTFLASTTTSSGGGGGGAAAGMNRRDECATDDVVILLNKYSASVDPKVSFIISPPPKHTLISICLSPISFTLFFPMIQYTKLCSLLCTHI